MTDSIQLPRVVGSAYFHIGNGGIELSIENRPNGSFLVVGAGHQGISTNEMVIPVDSNALRQLGWMFKDASEAPLMAHNYDLCATVAQRVKIKRSKSDLDFEDDLGDE